MGVGHYVTHPTLKISHTLEVCADSAPYDAKNVGCLSLASEMNGGNIPLRMMLKINVGCLSLASEMNGGNIRLRMTQKKMSGDCL